MTVTELRFLEAPIAPVRADEVPAALAGRATTYNAAVEAFQEAVRGALSAAQGGNAIGSRKAEALRALAADLAAARGWLLRSAGLPAPSRAS